MDMSAFKIKHFAHTNIVYNNNDNNHDREAPKNNSNFEILFQISTVYRIANHSDRWGQMA